MKGHTCRLLAFVYAAGCLVACVPWPHEVFRTQAIRGVLVKDSAPVRGVKVFLGDYWPSDGDSCSSRVSIAVTDAAGAFHIDSASDREPFRSLLNSPKMVGQLTALCFSDISQTKLGIVMVTPTDHRVTVTMSCDWNKSMGTFTQKDVSPQKFGICTDGV